MVEKLVLVRLVLVVSAMLLSARMVRVAASCTGSGALLLGLEDLGLLVVAVDHLAIWLFDVGVNRSCLDLPQTARSAGAGGNTSTCASTRLHVFGAFLKLAVAGLKILSALHVGTVLVRRLLALAAASYLEGSTVSGRRRGGDVRVFLAMELGRGQRATLEKKTKRRYVIDIPEDARF